MHLMVSVLSLLLWLSLLLLQLPITTKKKFKQLSDENFKKFLVVCTREGANINIPDEELLVGDKCKVDMGMIIPADGIVISSTNLKLDEAS